jgi:hypothetical protein
MVWCVYEERELEFELPIDIAVQIRPNVWHWYLKEVDKDYNRGKSARDCEIQRMASELRGLGFRAIGTCTDE